MTIILLQIGLIIAAYFIGSIPNGLLVGKVFKKIDIREHGSKNIGASNVIRVMGVKYGILVFALDAFKGALPILLLGLLKTSFDFETYITILNTHYNYDILFGVVAVFGHTFSIFNHFKGGKAVASSAGIVLTLTPIAGIICIITYILVVIITKYASLGSTFAAISVFIVAFIQFYIEGGVAGLQRNLFILIVYTLMIAFIFYKHRENYKRLLKGTENQMTFKKKPRN